MTFETFEEVLQYSEDGRQNLPLKGVRQVLGDQVIGRLRFELDGEIYSLWVDESHRRQGVATALWHEAESFYGVTLKHSPWRTDDGDAFAKSFNVELPERLVA